jgi:hypothetical protein
MNYQRFSNLENYVTEGEIITSDKIMEFCAKQESLLYYKRDFLLKGGVWRGRAVPPLLARQSLYRGKKVVLGHSDRSTTRLHRSMLMLSGAQGVAGFNFSAYQLRNSGGIPLGITNDCDDSPLHRILGNESHFLAANSMADWPTKFVNSIYLNMTLKNNVKERTKLYKAISSGNGVTISAPDLTNQGRVKYLINLRSHNLVPCPEGNGVDTHRLWETLYMGGTPVVKNNPILLPLISDLPVIVIDSWDKLLDLNFMERKWEEMNSRTYDFSKIKLSTQSERLIQF